MIQLMSWEITVQEDRNVDLKHSQHRIRYAYCDTVNLLLIGTLCFFLVFFIVFDICMLGHAASVVAFSQVHSLSTTIQLM